MRVMLKVKRDVWVFVCGVAMQVVWGRQDRKGVVGYLNPEEMKVGLTRRSKSRNVERRGWRERLERSAQSIVATQAVFESNSCTTLISL